MAAKYPHSTVDVYVKLPSGRNVHYDVESTDTIARVVDMVARDEGVDSIRVKLKYQGKILTSNKTVGWYGVRAETILKAQILEPKLLALTIHTPDGDKKEITLSTLDSCRTLYTLAEDHSVTPEHLVTVTHKGQKIENSTTTALMDVGIENCSDVYMTVRDIKAEEEKRKQDNTNKTDTMGEAEMEAVLSSFQTDGGQVEVVFSFDTTGSMYSYLSEVRSKLRDCCTRLLRDIPQIRIGLIAHGDYCDQDSYVLRSVDLTRDVDTLVTFANDVPSTSGGDSPECYEWVLRKAQHLDWAENSAKALVVIGDSNPHPPDYTDQNIRWRDELDVLKGMGVKVYGVQAGHIDDATLFYENISEETEGRHLRLNHFDVITDMFLAVCYREGNEQMLEQFQEEVQGEGRMTEQTKAMFEELKETDEEKKEKKNKLQGSASKPKRYTPCSWWDHSLCTRRTNPSFVYNEDRDEWKPFIQSASEVVESVPSSTRDRASFRNRASKRFRSFRSKSKTKCTIM